MTTVHAVCRCGAGAGGAGCGGSFAWWICICGCHCWLCAARADEMANLKPSVRSYLDTCTCVLSGCLHVQSKFKRLREYRQKTLHGDHRRFNAIILVCTYILSAYASVCTRRRAGWSNDVPEFCTGTVFPPGVFEPVYHRHHHRA